MTSIDFHTLTESEARQIVVHSAPGVLLRGGNGPPPASHWRQGLPWDEYCVLRFSPELRTRFAPLACVGLDAYDIFFHMLRVQKDGAPQYNDGSPQVGHVA